MNIVVCIKQVPASSNVQIDPVTGNLIRDANNTKMNPYDLYGIETALRIKELTGAHVSTISMGPPSAADVLTESLWMGCDDGYLLTDRKFAGADVVATAYALSQGIRKIGNFDLIICGKQTTDGDTAQVGPEIAEFLNIPHISYVDKIVEVKENSIVVSVSMDETIETWEIKYPCLITVDKGIYTPRLPSYKRGRTLKDKKINIFTQKDMEDTDEAHYGMNGSPTQVERMFPPMKNTDREVWKGSSEELSNQFFEKLKELKVL